MKKKTKSNRKTPRGKVIYRVDFPYGEVYCNKRPSKAWMRARALEMSGYDSRSVKAGWLDIDLEDTYIDRVEVEVV